MNEVFHYLTLILPGLCLAGLMLVMIPKPQMILRLMVIIASFILMRDSLIPAKLWNITNNLELRFAENSPALLILGLFSMAAVFALPKLLGNKLPLIKDKVWAAILAGLMGGLIIFAPTLMIETTLSTPQRIDVILSILFLSLSANCLEEFLFRGYLVTYLEEKDFTGFKAGLTSALLFSFCHSNLSANVTTVGVPILVFTLFEGLICAFLSARMGLLSAILAHGLGIFLISTKLV